mgnify:CR=1 FL=1
MIKISSTCPVCGKEIRTSEEEQRHARAHLEWLRRTGLVTVRIFRGPYGINIVYVRTSNGFWWEGRPDFILLARVWIWLTKQGLIASTVKINGGEVYFVEPVAVTDFTLKVAGFLVNYLAEHFSRTATLSTKRLAYAMKLRSLSERIKAWRVVKKVDRVKAGESLWVAAIKYPKKIKFSRLDTSTLPTK